MPDQNNTQTPNPANNAAEPVNVDANSVVVDPNVPDVAPKSTDEQAPRVAGVVADVVEKINGSHNVLIALSSDPSVDEMAAAIGLSLYLDKLGKRATAIYSGTTPNTLEFLKPEDTFEASVDALQDFIVALSKEKADHLRYKLDGDFVKIYITPYRTRISKDDLDFSYGDFNVDLVLALNVTNGADLDSALREHGRIMHDASVVNITVGNPGKFGEIEWSEKAASSISEMVADLLYKMAKDNPIEKEEATAFLTGIVAATDRFSNAKTTPETMQISSKLMESGANQQLISKNITPEIENKLLNPKSQKQSKDDASLAVDHSDETLEPTVKEEDATRLDLDHTAKTEESSEKNQDEPEQVSESTTNIQNEPSELLDDLKAAEASLAGAGAEAVPEPIREPVDVNDAQAMELTTTPQDQPDVAPSEDDQSTEKVVQPPADLVSDVAGADSDKYGRMLEDALGSVEAPSVESSLPQVEQPPATPADTAPTDNPAAASTPEVPVNPEINGVPSINYMPMPGEEVLPPPPAPPVDFSANDSEPAATAAAPEAATAPVLPDVAPIEPAAPAVEPTPEPLGSQPAMQDQVYAPQAADPGAFKIPGM